MTNKKIYSFLIVGALVMTTDAVLADTGSTGASYQTLVDSYNSSANTSYRQPVGTSRLVTTKSTSPKKVSSTASTSTQNSSAFRRPRAYQYRKGYQRKTSCRKVKKHRKGGGLPGHNNHSASVPELDASISQSAFVLLIGSVLVLRGRRRRDKNSK